MRVLSVLCLAPAAAAQKPSQPALPSETPEKFEAVTDGFDHVRRQVLVPMRDGVKLYTVVLVPKGAQGAPILLTVRFRQQGIPYVYEQVVNGGKREGSGAGL